MLQSKNCSCTPKAWIFLNKGNSIRFMDKVNKDFRIKLPKNSVWKQSTHLAFNMGIVTWSFMKIKYVNIVWWQENISCFSDIPKSAQKGKFAAAWQYSRKLITQERIYESLHRLLFFTCFCKGETLACSFP